MTLWLSTLLHWVVIAFVFWVLIPDDVAHQNEMMSPVVTE